MDHPVARLIKMPQDGSSKYINKYKQLLFILLFVVMQCKMILFFFVVNEKRARSCVTFKNRGSYCSYPRCR